MNADSSLEKGNAAEICWKRVAMGRPTSSVSRAIFCLLSPSIVTLPNLALRVDPRLMLFCVELAASATLPA